MFAFNNIHLCIYIYIFFFSFCSYSENVLSPKSSYNECIQLKSRYDLKKGSEDLKLAYLDDTSYTMRE